MVLSLVGEQYLLPTGDLFLYCQLSWPPQLRFLLVQQLLLHIWNHVTLLQFPLLRIGCKSSKVWSKHSFIVFNNWNCYNFTNILRPSHLCNSNIIEMFAFTGPTLRQALIDLFTFPSSSTCVLLCIRFSCHQLIKSRDHHMTAVFQVWVPVHSFGNWIRNNFY